MIFNLIIILFFTVSPYSRTIICENSVTYQTNIEQPSITLVYKNDGKQWFMGNDLRPANIEYTIVNEDGSEMIVSIVYDYFKPVFAIGMYWENGQDNWRISGDKNPHPDQIYALSLEEATHLNNLCKDLYEP